MRANVPRAILEVHYEATADEYLRKLKRVGFSDETPQASQREITLASLALVHERRPEVQFFNELLVQYPIGNRRKPGQVVPDNMIDRGASRADPCPRPLPPGASTPWRFNPRSRSG